MEIHCLQIADGYVLNIQGQLLGNDLIVKMHAAPAGEYQIR